MVPALALAISVLYALAFFWIGGIIEDEIKKGPYPYTNSYYTVSEYTGLRTAFSAVIIVYIVIFVAGALAGLEGMMSLYLWGATLSILAAAMGALGHFLVSARKDVITFSAEAKEIPPVQ